MTRIPAIILALTVPASALAQAPKAAPRRTISDADRSDLIARTERLESILKPLAGRSFGETIRPADALADAAVMAKAARWIVRLGEFFADDSVAKTGRVLDLGMGRAADLAAGRVPWASARGGVARGYVSKVDGSIQPYAVYVPESYDGQSRIRLDVILHGRDATLTEVKFLLAHQGKPMPEGETGLVLHVFGRGNVAYRWAGETDVLEAIEAVKRNYRVDDRRVVLRGFSMGGAGAWHLGLHRPALWCAVEAGAGFTETIQYAKLGEVSDLQKALLTINDPVSYAINARDVPIAGYGGEDDPQLRASENIVEALKAQGVGLKTDGLVTRAEGLEFMRVIGAKTGHAVDPASAQILKTFRDEHAATGRPEPRPTIRFETYTLRYPSADWITIQAMGEHYRRARVEADIKDEVATIRTENVAMLSVDREAARTVVLDGVSLPLRDAVRGLLPEVYFLKVETGWETLDYEQSRDLQLNAPGRKRPGLQGPIDDAFTESFLCVRGTGQPWNPAVAAWSNARLERFAAEWSEFLRGDLPIKDDKDVTPEDVATRHLILFGDPGSNSWVARVAGALPMKWTRDEVAVAPSGSFPATDHVPALVAANPRNPLRYVVLNSGHTFGAADFRGTNALLYPRLGDWAVLKVGDAGEAPERTGLFDERWRPR